MSDRELREALALSIGRKSIILAFILWFFLGAFGIHRIYLGKTASGIIMAALTIIGGATSGILIGIPLLVIVGIWWLLDAILIIIAARRHNRLHDRIARG